MRPVLVILGVVILLIGIGFALQGAYIIPATFMRGPEWIAIGIGVAVVGAVVLLMGLRRKRTVPSTGDPSAHE